MDANDDTPSGGERLSEHSDTNEHGPTRREFLQTSAAAAGVSLVDIEPAPADELTSVPQPITDHIGGGFSVHEQYGDASVSVNGFSEWVDGGHRPVIELNFSVGIGSAGITLEPETARHVARLLLGAIEKAEADADEHGR